MQHLHNTESHGVYLTRDSRKINGPILHKVMPKPDLTIQEQYNLGLITVNEYHKEHRVIGSLTMGDVNRRQYNR